MFNQLLLSAYNAIYGGTFLFWIVVSILSLIISEILFIYNIKENNKPISRQNRIDFPFMSRAACKNDIRFVLGCKVAYIFVSFFLSIFIIGIFCAIGALIYYVNVLSILCFRAGVIFILINYYVVIFILINYYVYQKFKKVK